MTVKQSAKRAVKYLRDIADRIEKGEGEYSVANLSVELLFEELPTSLHPSKITDNLEVNSLKPTCYMITLKVDLPVKSNRATK